MLPILVLPRLRVAEGVRRQLAAGNIDFKYYLHEFKIFCKIGSDTVFKFRKDQSANKTNKQASFYSLFNISCVFNHIFSFFQFATDIPEQGLLYFYSVYGYIFYHRALRITYS